MVSINIHVYIGIYLYIHGKILVSDSYSSHTGLLPHPGPLNSLAPPPLDMCSLLLPGRLSETLAHFHPLAFGSHDHFSEACRATHPSGLPQLVSIPSPCFSFSWHSSQSLIISFISLFNPLVFGEDRGCDHHIHCCD